MGKQEDLTIVVPVGAPGGGTALGTPQDVRAYQLKCLQFSGFSGGVFRVLGSVNGTAPFMPLDCPDISADGFYTVKEPVKEIRLEKLVEVVGGVHPACYFGGYYTRD